MSVTVPPPVVGPRLRSIPPLPPGEPDVLTPQEREAMGKFRQHLLMGRETRMNGTLKYEVEFKDGGIVGRKAVVEVREKV